MASYSGNGIATTPENQFKPEEFGPTRLDERHRIVLSGVFNFRGDFQLAPIMQLASSRPFSANTGLDIDGDGLATNDDCAPALIQWLYLQCVEIRQRSGHSIRAAARRPMSSLRTRPDCRTGRSYSPG